MTAVAKHWSLIALVLVIALAGWQPSWGEANGLLHPELTIHLAIAVAFFVTGWTLPTSMLRQAAGHWRLHTLVQVFSFVIIPLTLWPLAWVATHLGMPAVLADGFLVLACVPTTIASCVIFTRTARGNEAAALCNAIGGNLIGLLISPLLIVLLIGVHGDAPILSVLKQLSFDVVIPLIVGQVCRLLHVPKPQLQLNTVPPLMLLYIIFCVFSSTFSHGLEAGLGLALVWTITLALLTHLIYVSASWGLSGWSKLRFSNSDRIAIVFCSPQKTMALGIPMVSILFAGHPQLALLSLPLVIYHPLQLLISGVLAARLRQETTQPAA